MNELKLNMRFQVLETESSMFLVMEYCAGGHLEDYISPTRPMSEVLLFFFISLEPRFEQTTTYEPQIRALLPKPASIKTALSQAEIRNPENESPKALRGAREHPFQERGSPSTRLNQPFSFANRNPEPGVRMSKGPWCCG